MAKLLGMPTNKNRPNWKQMFVSAEDSIFYLGEEVVRATAHAIGPWFVVQTLAEYIDDFLDENVEHEHDPACPCATLVPEIRDLGTSLKRLIEKKRNVE